MQKQHNSTDNLSVAVGWIGFIIAVALVVSTGDVSIGLIIAGITILLIFVNFMISRHQRETTGG